jgi:hypothetical protein
MTFDERMQRLMQSMESHDRQIRELTDKIAAIGEKVAEGQIMSSRLLLSVQTLAGAVSTLADVANNHERRLTGLKDRRI